jgi:hypothetical protein
MLASQLCSSLNFIASLLCILFCFEFERDYNGPFNSVETEL